ncbi:MAG: hypothetical protein AAF467_17665 [Actinomycetota bacterium]
MFTRLTEMTCVRTALLAAGALVLAACGGGDDELVPPDDTASQVSTDETEAPEVDTDDEAAADATEATESSDSTTTTASESTDFTPATVSFDPDNPPPLAEVEQLAFDAVEGAFLNRLWCLENLDICDAEVHLSPALEASFEMQTSAEIEEFQAEDGDYRRSDQDGIYLVDSQATVDGEFTFGEDNSLRVLGTVETCETYAGEYYVSGELSNDQATGYVTTKEIWQHVDGTLVVSFQGFTEGDSGGLEFCDPYRE